MAVVVDVVVAERLFDVTDSDGVWVAAATCVGTQLINVGIVVVVGCCCAAVSSTNYYLSFSNCAYTTFENYTNKSLIFLNFFHLYFLILFYYMRRTLKNMNLSRIICFMEMRLNFRGRMKDRYWKWI